MHTACPCDICQSCLERAECRHFAYSFFSHSVCFILLIFSQEVKPPMVSALCLSLKGTQGAGKFLPLGGLQELRVPLPPPLARPAMKTTATAIFGDLVYSSSLFLPLFVLEGCWLIRYAIRASPLTRLRMQG